MFKENNLISVIVFFLNFFFALLHAFFLKISFFFCNSAGFFRIKEICWRRVTWKSQVTNLVGWRSWAFRRWLSGSMSWTVWAKGTTRESCWMASSNSVICATSWRTTFGSSFSPSYGSSSTESNAKIFWLHSSKTEILYDIFCFELLFVRRSFLLTHSHQAQRDLVHSPIQAIFDAMIRCDGVQLKLHPMSILFLGERQNLWYRSVFLLEEITIPPQLVLANPKGGQKGAQQLQASVC